MPVPANPGSFYVALVQSSIWACSLRPAYTFMDFYLSDSILNPSITEELIFAELSYWNVGKILPISWNGSVWELSRKKLVQLMLGQLSPESSTVFLLRLAYGETYNLCVCTLRECFLFLYSLVFPLLRCLFSLFTNSRFIFSFFLPLIWDN